jgi:hypothetical protein
LNPLASRVLVESRVIDTGSSLTGFDPSILVQALDLSPVGEVEMTTPSTGATPHVFLQYHVDLTLIHAELVMRLPEQIVFATQFSQGENVMGLIGRDVLEHCLFLCHGEAGTFTLAF